MNTSTLVPYKVKTPKLKISLIILQMTEVKMSYEFKGYVWLQRNSNNHDYIIVWWIKSIIMID